MRPPYTISSRLISGALLLGGFCTISLAQQSATPQPAQLEPTQPDQILIAELPDSPGFVLLGKQSDKQPDKSSDQQIAQSAQASQPAPITPEASPQVPPAQSNTPQRPVGTAAAEAATVSGVTAAQPAGVAIAPGKQRRSHSLILKVGAIVGAGVAVGSVVALTSATASKPPGAH